MVALDAKVINDYISLLPKDKIELEVDKQGGVSVTCAGYKTKMRSANNDDFPIIPTIEDGEKIICDATSLKKAVTSTIFAASDSRPELKGIFIQVEGKKMRLAATDAYRLAEQSIDLANEAKKTSFIAPLKTTQEVARILQDSTSQDIELSWQDQQIQFSNDEVTLVSRTVDEQYPDYNQIIPSNTTTQLTLTRTDLIKAVKATSIFAQKSLQDVTLDCQPQDNKIFISSANTTVGESTVDLNASGTGSAVKVVLNHRYLAEGLNQIGQDEVELSIVDADSPCIFRGKGDKDYLYLVMPIQQ